MRHGDCFCCACALSKAVQGAPSEFPPQPPLLLAYFWLGLGRELQPAPMAASLEEADAKGLSGAAQPQPQPKLMQPPLVPHGAVACLLRPRTARSSLPGARQGRPYNNKADIWALGCILVELMSGRLAFEGSTLQELYTKCVARTLEECTHLEPPPRRAPEERSADGWQENCNPSPLSLMVDEQIGMDAKLPAVIPGGGGRAAEVLDNKPAGGTFVSLDTGF